MLTCVSSAPTCMWLITRLLADSGKSAGRNGLIRSASSTASGSMIALVHGKFYPQVTPASPELSFFTACELNMCCCMSSCQAVCCMWPHNNAHCTDVLRCLPLCCARCIQAELL